MTARGAAAVPKRPPTPLCPIPCPHCRPTAYEWGHQDKPTQGTPHRTPRAPRQPGGLRATEPWWQKVAVTGSWPCSQWVPPQAGPPPASPAPLPPSISPGPAPGWWRRWRPLSCSGSGCWQSWPWGGPGPPFPTTVSSPTTASPLRPEPSSSTSWSGSCSRRPSSPGARTTAVLAYNRHTYETVAQLLIVTVVPAPGGEPPYQGEFLVGNRNVEELLPVAAQETFLGATAGVWEQDDLHVINITSALDRGGRVPLPIEGRKEGVYVKVGSRGGFSPCLASAASPQSRFRCSLGQQPLASCYDTFAPHFTIRWCNLTLLQVWPSPTSPGPVWGSGVLEEGGDFQPPTEVPPRDLLPGYLVTLLVPLAVAALLCLLLGHLMCCRREGVQKRDLETSDIQLVHHTTIHGDTEELRHMAGSRDVPRPLSTLPMFNVRTGQRINPMPGPSDGARVPLLPQ
ncbi:alpha-sarcoglycan isoform X3 [Larus michahellis]|uniref:alpha-sarcoglycan isoform X3 n=1 Tax=Larus michahellis TaxID=119627 RepID=UPI003D9BC842